MSLKPTLDDFELFAVEANGIHHRVATAEGFAPYSRMRTQQQYRQQRTHTADMPLVMLLHGWPESWYSWRHQLWALASAGYPVCAPDMRGFGGTDAPADVDEYTLDKLCLDVLGIAESLGSEKIVAIGHDFGSYLAWHLALLHPDAVVAVCGMSVPYLGHSPQSEPLLSRLQRDFGTCLPQSPYCASRQQQAKARFQYILHHNLPHAADEYDKNCEEALYRLYSFSKPQIDHEPPEVKGKLMFPVNYRHAASENDILDARSAPGVWARLPRPSSLPSFLSPNDFEYFVRQFRASGFAGGLKWYQALDANWRKTLDLRGKRIEQPSLFIVGDEDRMVLSNHGGLENVVLGLRRNCSNLCDCVVLRDTGHWVQQERPEEVNLALHRFLSQVLIQTAVHSSRTTSKL